VPGQCTRAWAPAQGYPFAAGSTRGHWGRPGPRRGVRGFRGEALRPEDPGAWGVRRLRLAPEGVGVGLVRAAPEDFFSGDFLGGWVLSGDFVGGRVLSGDFLGRGVLGRAEERAEEFGRAEERAEEFGRAEERAEALVLVPRGRGFPGDAAPEAPAAIRASAATNFASASRSRAAKTSTCRCASAACCTIRRWSRRVWTTALRSVLIPPSLRFAGRRWRGGAFFLGIPGLYPAAGTTSSRIPKTRWKRAATSAACHA